MLTTLGLSVALLGIVVLAIGQAGAGHDGIHALDWHALRLAAHALPKDATLVAFVLLLAGPGDEDRLGARPQLAARRPQRGAAADQRHAVRGAAADRAADRLAGQADPRTVCRRRHDPRGVPRVRPRVDRDRDPVPVAGAAVEAAARLLEPRAHGRDRARDRVRHAARDRRGRDPRRRSRTREVARLLRCASRLSRIDPKASARPPSGVAGTSPSTATAMGVSLAALAGLPPSPLFLSELLIVLGGIQAGLIAVSVTAVIALALGFLGLLHALIEGVIGERPKRRTPPPRARAAPDHRAHCRPRHRDARAVRARADTPRLRLRADADEERAVTQIEQIPPRQWRRCRRASPRRRRTVRRRVGDASQPATVLARAVHHAGSAPGMLSTDASNSSGRQHRRPRPRRELGRARGPRPLRPGVRRPRADAGARHPYRRRQSGG